MGRVTMYESKDGAMWRKEALQKARDAIVDRVQAFSASLPARRRLSDRTMAVCVELLEYEAAQAKAKAEAEAQAGEGEPEAA